MKYEEFNPDEVVLDEDAWIDLFHRYQKDFPNGGNELLYLKSPSLPYFRMKLVPRGGEYEFCLDFMPPEFCGTRCWRCRDGHYARTVVAVRMYGHSLISEAVVCLGLIKEGGEDRYYSDWIVQKPAELEKGKGEGMAWAAYSIVQYALRNRPELIHVSTGHREVCSGNARKRKKGPKVVQAYRVIQIGEKISEPTGRHMTCPCWGVIGHWRTYKSGKQVWIKPYRKGKDRNHPLTYEPKEYQLMKEETDEVHTV